MSQKKLKARITGIGACLPAKVLSNVDLEKMVDTSDEWIFTRTGIKERRIAGDNEYPSTMGAHAAQRAIKDAGIEASSIEMIIVATMSPDYLSASTAALIQHDIKAENAAAVDIQAACSGFIYALSLAKAYVESGLYHYVLVVASEKMSAYVDYTDRNTCVLFGDGAAAVVVTGEGSGLSIDALCIGADGGQSQLLRMPAGGSRVPASQESVAMGQHFLKMEGKEVFKHAVRQMTASARKCLAQLSLSEEEIDWLVPHQANARIIDAVAKNFSIPSEKVFKTVHKYGNTSASSIPIALEELLKSNQMKKNQRILLVSFGAGLTYGSAVLTQL